MNGKQPMKPSDTPSEEEIFDDARQLTDPAERRALLDRTCARNPTLRARLEGLLAADHEAGNFFDECTRALQIPAPLPTLKRRAGATDSTPVALGCTASSAARSSPARWYRRAASLVTHRLMTTASAGATVDGRTIGASDKTSAAT